MAARVFDGAAKKGQSIRTGDRVAVITAAETNQLLTGLGKVGQVSVWGDDAGTSCVVTVYDHASGTTNPIWRWATAQGLGTFALQAPVENGIRVVVGGTVPTNGGVTVVFE